MAVFSIILPLERLFSVLIDQQSLFLDHSHFDFDLFLLANASSLLRLQWIPSDVSV
ncbi:MAG: hypothetical protein ACI8TS_000819 [Flavobacteriales bacterium]|jgi:hypothetical protein